uniref:Uncharacterized protein n=1 Tax=Octopus bimaculoides TaxID=37653 RepID=A0A0L8HTQ6_OCTBM
MNAAFYQLTSHLGGNYNLNKWSVSHIFEKSLLELNFKRQALKYYSQSQFLSDRAYNRNFMRICTFFISCSFTALLLLTYFKFHNNISAYSS